MKIPERLELLVQDGAIEKVVQPIMSGKEASLYVVLVDGKPCAAKVYKEAQSRSFRQRADYVEGRQVRGSRQQRALVNKSRFGKELLEESWQTAELDALQRLETAGVRVPHPLLFVDNVLVMSLVLDAEGRAAPRLSDLEFYPQEARYLMGVLLDQIIRMLCAGIVHGDLSEYNVLMSHEGPVIIDLPQAISVSHNRNARALLLRDVNNITRFVARFAPEYNRARYGEEIWSLYERGILAPGARLSGRFVPEERAVDGRRVLQEISELEQDEARQHPSRRVVEIQSENKSQRSQSKPASRPDQPQRQGPQRAASQGGPRSPRRGPNRPGSGRGPR